ncbi:tryptophan dimethylallyltransferase family protein [Streptomyces aurantiogriseus]|uniref:Prenyltransferase n=1 Tax=Streptomyces aurantiogriseus TaxID=66870 RepID=A0A918BX26_9ACTN|nr:tryptophan dimethylallyltransferase family protein [Streptomyces aurantiogriseus]GGQ96867.1 prenyltransferase [Streptomyces aurantiogriseus]
MTARPDVHGTSGAPTLGALTAGQLVRLCDVAGLSLADAYAYATVLIEALGPVAERPLDLPPLYRTFLSDDHTPVEYSLSFPPNGAPALRVLLEPGYAAGGRWARNGRAGLRAIREMAQRWNITTDLLDGLEDLFFPPSPQGPLALLCALELRPGGVPRMKVYLNPAARGEERSAETVREALHRLGHRRAFASLPAADGYPFLALDLGDWETPRVKVYLRHDGLAAEEAPALCRMDPGPAPAEIEEFVRTAAGLAPDLLDADSSETGGVAARLTRRPVLTCHSFTDKESDGPCGFTLHIPVRDYVRHDGEAVARAVTLLGRYGMDTAPLLRAPSAVTSRRLEDGVGLIAYLALAHQHGRPPRVTAYVSAEAYEVRPPLGSRPARAATAGGR